MISWFPIFPGGCRWEEGTRVLCDAPQGVRLRPEPPTISPPILSVDRPWEAGDIGWGTVLHDQGCYRMWYGISGFSRQAHRQSCLCYAESDDGVEWRKPDLGLVEFDGSTANNILLKDYPEFHVFVDPSASPAARYRCVIFTTKDPLIDGASPGTTKHHVLGGESPDGLRWTIYPEPILDDGITHDTQNIVTYDAARGKYVGYFRMFYCYHRAIGWSETDDFKHWPPTQMCHQKAIEDAPDATLYSNAYTLYPDNPDIHLMFPGIYHQLDDTVDAQLMTSRDGRSWARHMSKPLISLPVDAYPDVAGIYPLPHLLRDTRTRTFRLPTRLVTVYHNQQHEEPANSYVWAQWPEDRLGGLYAEAEGQFSIQPFSCEEYLLASFRTEPDGWIRFELAPPPVWPPQTVPGFEGYRFEDAQPLTGDASHVPLRWGDKTSLAKLGRDPVMIRVKMHKATLYSVTMNDSPSLGV